MKKLTLLLFTFLLSFAAMAADWNGTTASDFGTQAANAGESEANPIIITTPMQWMFASTLTVTDRAKKFALGDNLDFKNMAGAKPFGALTAGAVFDGKGYTISNIILNSTSVVQGLFTTVTSATVKNLGLTGTGNIKGISNSGGIVCTAATSTISNCYNTTSVSGDIVSTQSGNTKAFGIGGIVGACNGSTIEDCYNTGTITGVGRVAGIVGYISGNNSSISRCYNTGTINGVYRSGATNYGDCGGILGANVSKTVTVESCYNTGSVSVAGFTGKNSYVGGILGTQTPGSSINNCFNTGTVSLDNTNNTALTITAAGGIIGICGQAVTNCYNTGTVQVIAGPTVSTKGGINGSGSVDIPVNCFTLTGTGYNDATATTPRIKTAAELQESAFVTAINNSQNPVKWKADYGTHLNGGYPILVYMTSTLPDPPTDVVASIGNTESSVAFTAPVYTGGSAILDYTVIPYIAEVAGTPVTGANSPIVVTGLSNGTTYTFTVTARNINGNSAPSIVSNEVIPVAATSNISVSSSTSISAMTLTPASEITVDNGGLLTVDEAVTVKSITVTPGAKLTLTSGKLLTVTNGITLQSDATGTATLVDNTTDDPQAITATIQQYMPQGRNWYLSTPISSCNASNLIVSGLGSSVSYYDEKDGWVHNYTGTLTPGVGYISVSNSGNETNCTQFTGTINTGTVEVTLTKQGEAPYAGFNLVANPYPSYLNAMVAINSNNNLVPTIWYRTRSTGTTPTYYFETVNTASGVGTNASGTGMVTGYIPPMQAFWVQTNSDNQTLTFDNSMRYHAGNVTVESETVPTTPMKTKSNENQSLLRLQVSDGANSDETVLYFNSNASDTYDAYDSPKRSNANVIIPEIYTVVGNKQLAINGLRTVFPNEELSLGFIPGASKNFSIKATEVTNFDAGTRIILRDNQVNTEQELTVGTLYAFSSDPTPAPNRFSVIFRTNSSITSIKSSFDNSSVFVYRNSNNKIVVNVPSEIVNKSMLTVYNSVGQKLENKSLTNTINILENSYTPGVYMVSVSTNGKAIARKVVID